MGPARSPPGSPCNEDYNLYVYIYIIYIYIIYIYIMGLLWGPRFMETGKSPPHSATAQDYGLCIPRPAGVTSWEQEMALTKDLWTKTTGSRYPTFEASGSSSHPWEPGT